MLFLFASIAHICGVCIQNMFLSRPSKYLKMPQALLLGALRRQLDHPLKTTNEKVFIQARLTLLDLYIYLEITVHLWRTYFDIGCKEHIWPVSINTNC